MERKWACSSWEELDECLVKYLFHLCYVDDKHPLQGAMAVNAICYLFPEASRLLPRAWRSNESFGKLTVLEQGKPTGLETL
eukprot:12168572-Heterocapsa_arctica.AAC.1